VKVTRELLASILGYHACLLCRKLFGVVIGRVGVALEGIVWKQVGAV
jgi:hypothetical protein